ncbi:DinB family protein [Pseudogracilibacillus sp. SO30301A]|uniref:DinB family protein n=1 Tax=Pseudogracilibacillus sp. SO30301A TaxID=3098291 RepID=UPI00300DCE9C
MQTTEKVQSVHHNIDEMIAFVRGLDEKTIRWNPTEDEWSIMQIIVHVAEAIPFWLREIERIIEDSSAKWGRGLTDEDRLYAVSDENIQNVKVDDAIRDLKKIPSLVEKSLSSLTEDQLKIVAPCHNPNFEGKPVQFIIDNLVVKHVEGHLGQIKRNLSKLDDEEN